jgi:hypothetical protein
MDRLPTHLRALSITLFLVPMSLASCAGAELVEEEPPAPEPDDDDEFRDDTCGAGRKLGKVNQTCKYEPSLKYGADYEHNWIGNTTGSCKKNDSDHVYCTYSLGSYCTWWGSQTGGSCLTDGPNTDKVCTNPPAQGPDSSTPHTIDLASGNKLCDPPKPAADLAKYCRDNIPKDMWKKVQATCLAVKPVETTKEINCCVAKPKPAATSSGGDGESGANAGESSGSVGPTTEDGGDVSWPDLGSPNDACPAGTVEQCTIDEYGVQSCVCVA